MEGERGEVGVFLVGRKEGGGWGGYCIRCVQSGAEKGRA